MTASLDGVASLQFPVVAEQDDTDFIFIDIEGNALDTAGKFQDFFEADAGQAGDLGDTRRDAGDVADFASFQRCDKTLAGETNLGKRILQNGLH